jgi:lipopolysaccharide export LptBFGC system permease protein LptF
VRELVFELLLRLVKPALAALIGLLAWALATGPGGASGSAELGLLCFAVGGVIVLLVQEGPI